MRLTGWGIEGNFPDTPRLVVAVAPHTSNWDFLHGAAAMFALDLRATFIGKHTLFVWPFAGFLRWMGGIPVDRSAAQGVVGEAVAAFGREPARMLVIAPEGTRRKVERYKTGFLHIARGARVPVLLDRARLRDAHHPHRARLRGRRGHRGRAPQGRGALREDPGPLPPVGASGTGPRARGPTHRGAAVHQSVAPRPLPARGENSSTR